MQKSLCLPVAYIGLLIVSGKKKTKMITYTDHPDIVYIKIVLILLHVVKIQLCSCQSPYASIEKCLHPIESMI